MCEVSNFSNMSDRRSCLNKLLILLILCVICSFVMGCKKDTVKIESVKGTSFSNTESDYKYRFKNISKDYYFRKCNIWAEDSNGKIIKKKIDKTFHQPIVSVFQRNFDSEGKDDLLVVTKYNVGKDSFAFYVILSDENFETKEIFDATGSLEDCDYWLLTKDNNLIHLISQRDYSKPDNAVYKSRYKAEFYRFEKKNGKTEFKQYRSLTTKRELDSLDDIKIALGIDKEAVSLYDLKAR